MNIIGIEHANVFIDGEKKDVLLNLELDNEERKILHVLHKNSGNKDYLPEDVSVIAFITVYCNKDGKMESMAYNGTEYYPADQGETHVPECLISGELKNACFEYIKANYLGSERKYDEK